MNMVKSMQRYFVEKMENHRFTLSGDDSYHIVTVMRMGLGSTIEIVSQGRIYLSKVILLEPLVEVKVIKEIEEDNELKCSVTLAQALVKEQKMDVILQKTTELGMACFIPFEAERSIVQMNKKETKKIERWQRIVKEASEQSKRNLIPLVGTVMSVSELSKIEGYDLKLLCTVRENTKNIKNVLSNRWDGAKMIVVVGPEGGFTEREEQELIRGGFQTVSLGKSVLRTETAPIFIMSVVRYLDMR